MFYSSQISSLVQVSLKPHTFENTESTCMCITLDTINTVFIIVQCFFDSVQNQTFLFFYKPLLDRKGFIF